MIRGVLFDLDGTLLDTLDEITGCLNQALADHDLPSHDREAVREWVGDGTDRLVRRALTPGDRHLQDSVLAAVRVAFERRAGASSRPYPGIPDLLAALRRTDLQLGVLTNKPQDAADALIGRFFPATFALVQGLREGQARKPALAATRRAMTGLGLGPEETRLVGDSEIDIAAGREAGLQVVAVSWGFRSRDRLVALRPDALVDTPEELWRALFAELPRRYE